MVWPLLYFVILCIFSLQSQDLLDQHLLVIVSFRHSAFGLSSFSVKAIIHWNTLPEDIRMDMFKLKLKSHLKSTQIRKH